MKVLFLTLFALALPLFAHAQVNKLPLSAWDAEHIGLPESAKRESLLYGRERWERVEEFSQTSRLRYLARSVGRLKIKSREDFANCTGFIVGPDTIMTAYHCISLIKGKVDGIRFELGLYSSQSNLDFERYEMELEPVAADQKLDFLILKAQKPFGRKWVISKLNDSTIVEGQPLQIFHHPRAAPMKISRKGCLGGPKADNIPAGHFQHKCDTLPGSSGAPIINENGYVVGFHHMGSEETPSNAMNKGTLLASLTDVPSLTFASDAAPVQGRQIDDFEMLPLTFPQGDDRFFLYNRYKRNCFSLEGVLIDRNYFSKMLCSPSKCEIEFTDKATGLNNSVSFHIEDIFYKEVFLGGDTYFDLECEFGNCINFDDGTRSNYYRVYFSDAKCGRTYLDLDNRLDNRKPK